MPTALVSAVLMMTLGLTPGEFEKLHAELQPPKDELWSSIPWELSILEAQKKSAQEKKPVFMWVMNGNPCGAT